MSIENQKQTSFKEKLDKTYRLILQKSETFEEKIAFNFKVWQLYLISSLALVALIMLIGSLIMFTPIKKLVPGYGEISQYQEIFDLHEQLDAMQKKITAHETYTSRFMKMLQDSVETEADIKKRMIDKPDGKYSAAVEKVKEDDELRKEIEEDAQLEEAALLAKSTSDSKILPLEKLFFIPPVEGPISAAFMPEKKHIGVDILAPKNSPIKSVLDGYVITADWTMETGNTIGIMHDNNVITFYKHNSNLLKKAGDYVKAGEAIAIIGNTGTLTDGPHLHFELWHKGRPLDPEDYVQF